LLAPLPKRRAVRIIAPRVPKFGTTGGELSVSFPATCPRRKSLRYLLNRKFVWPIAGVHAVDR